MDKMEFIATHCYMCSCVNCPQTENEISNCYNNAVENKNNQIMTKAAVFGFIAKLHRADSENPKSYFIAPFKVLAKTHDDAKNKLLEYLSRPEQTGLKYERCLELIDSSADIILIDNNFGG